jgi:multiple sugar transport system substrate-binding protein
MSSFTEFTKFRPGVDAYPSVSIEIQTAVESVVSGQMTAAEAASVYARNVKSIVGDGNWIEK